jgi:hypothetical protein
VELIPTARDLLTVFRENSVPLLCERADDLLLFLIRLRDDFEIRQSKSPRFSGSALHLLRWFIEELEADPDRVLRNNQQRELLRTILEDIVSGRVLLRRKFP